MHRSSNLFLDPKRRKSLALLMDYDIDNPQPLPSTFSEQYKPKQKKSSFAPTHLKSAHSTFDLKGSHESKSFAPSRSISMSHLSLTSNPLATPMSKKGAFHPSAVLETPKITGLVDPRPIREKEFISNSARMIYAFLTGNGYPNPVTVKAISKPELSTQEILNVFTFLLSFIGAELAHGNEQPVKEDIPNALAYIGYPFSIKKSTIAAINTNHNWPTILAAIRWIVELLEAVMGHDIGCDILFSADTDENFRSRESLKDEMIRITQMFRHKDEPDVLGTLAAERDEYYRETLTSLREEKARLERSCEQLLSSVTRKEKDTLAVHQNVYNEKNDELVASERELVALSANLLIRKETKRHLNAKITDLQRETFEMNRKCETLSAQVDCQAINMAEALEIKEDMKSDRLEIEQLRNSISNSNDTLVYLRMQLSKQMGRIRPLMSEVNLVLKEMKLEFQNCHSGLSDQLGLDEFISSPERLSNDVHNNLAIIQQLKGLETGVISKMKQESLEMKTSIQSLETSIHDAELKLSEIEHEIKLQQDMNEGLQRKLMEFKEEKSDKRNKHIDELYELRRSCEESHRLVIQNETRRDQIISAGREENRRMNEELTHLAGKVEEVTDQIVKLVKDRDEIVSKLGPFYEEYKAKFKMD